MDKLTKQGADAFKAGNKNEARKLLLAAVKQHSDSERAWGWLYNVTKNDKERTHCLNQMLRINPENEKAKELLAQITNSEPPLESSQNVPPINNIQNQVSKKQNFPTKDFSNKKKTNKIIIIIGGLIIFCCIFFIFISFLPESDNSIAAPDVESLPAAEPEEATSEPLPTNTPEPIAPPVESLASPENLAYSEEITLILQTYGETSLRLGELLGSGSEDPSLFFDDDWTIKVALNLVVIELQADKIKTIIPPPDMVPTHAWMLKLAEETYLMKANLTYGIDNFDPDAMQASIENMENMSRYTNNVTEEILKLAP